MLNKLNVATYLLDTIEYDCLFLCTSQFTAENDIT